MVVGVRKELFRWCLKLDLVSATPLMGLRYDTGMYVWMVVARKE